MKKINKTIIMSIFLLALVMPTVTAFAVSSPYFSGHPLTLQPGESKEITLQIQNKAGEPVDFSASGEIVEGSEITEFIDSPPVYNLPFGSAVDTHLRVTIPNNAKPGDTWSLKVSYKVIPSEEKGGVTLGIGASANFQVLAYMPEPETLPTGRVVKEERGISSLEIIVVLLIIIIAAIVYFKTRKHKNF